MRLEGFVEKGWGYENIFSTNELYCGKILKFNKGGKFSMHFHQFKDESWYIISGKFLLRWIDTADATINEIELNESDVWRNRPCVPHQLICLEEGAVFEVSTPDSYSDNYRVFPGDSQKSVENQNSISIDSRENYDLMPQKDKEERSHQMRSYHHGDMRSYWER